MNLKCKKIQCALEIAIDDGNNIKEVQEGWSEASKVFIMDKELSESVKNKIITSKPDLLYWESKGSPMDPPDKGFKCIDCTFVISFPVKI